ncbi:hypothetical protein BC835DRAFT_428402 [Cytidiella melzeri]|nr:hypothetical protein BC835DRAFT_428402 [Cytidiella melzeri]
MSLQCIAMKRYGLMFIMGGACWLEGPVRNVGLFGIWQWVKKGTRRVTLGLGWRGAWRRTGIMRSRMRVVEACGGCTTWYVLKTIRECFTAVTITLLVQLPPRMEVHCCPLPSRIGALRLCLMVCRLCGVLRMSSVVQTFKDVKYFLDENCSCSYRMAGNTY